MGRECLKKWGFRRCEDICWIKTNIKNPGHSKNLEHNAVFQRTKEHCLMGIKGTVRRSVDGDFIHANVDIDLIISEDPEFGSTEKPIEIFHIMEHFCLGRRRWDWYIELFIYFFGSSNTNPISFFFFVKYHTISVICTFVPIPQTAKKNKVQHFYVAKIHWNVLCRH